MNPGPLDLKALDRNYLCIIQLPHDMPGALRQVTLSPDKIHDGLIRLGEIPNDEAIGWQYPQNVNVISIIGVAVEKEGVWSCRPMLEVVKDVG